ncbi:hypothetical protein TNCV_3694711 [Trichonephila clavipes]|nr:hypothetical protein TNCV_3694711 [Trichonephila clavipes]
MLILSTSSSQPIAARTIYSTPPPAWFPRPGLQDKRKSRAFADSLEESFTENKIPMMTIILTKWTEQIQASSDAHNLIPDFQHSFRKKTSTCHQLLRTTNKTIGGFNSHRTTEGLGRGDFKSQSTLLAREFEVSKPALHREVVCLLYCTVCLHTTSPPLQQWMFASSLTMQPFYPKRILRKQFGKPCKPTLEN